MFHGQGPFNIYERFMESLTTRVIRENALSNWSIVRPTFFFSRCCVHQICNPLRRTSTESPIKTSLFVLCLCMLMFSLEIPAHVTKKPESLRCSTLTSPPVVVKASRAYALSYGIQGEKERNLTFLALTWRSIIKPGASDSRDDIYKW